MSFFLQIAFVVIVFNLNVYIELHVYIEQLPLKIALWKEVIYMYVCFDLRQSADGNLRSGNCECPSEIFSSA